MKKVYSKLEMTKAAVKLQAVTATAPVSGAVVVKPA